MLVLLTCVSVPLGTVYSVPSMLRKSPKAKKPLQEDKAGSTACHNLKEGIFPPLAWRDNISCVLGLAAWRSEESAKHLPAHHFWR